jgi:GTP-binding protein
MTDPSPPSSPAPSSGDDEGAMAKRAMAWAHTARFLTTASKLSELPVSELPETAFVGRSNAGKSTAINVLTQQKRLAFASKTPGRTQHINLFELGPKLAPDALFADLPGYGYAAVERSKKLRWQEVMAEYLEVRRNLTAIVVLLDSRLGFTELDMNLLEFVGVRVGNGSVKMLVLLTKADKLGRRALDKALASAQDTLAPLIGESADVGVAPFSALSRQGVNDAALWLRRSIAVPGGPRSLAAVGRRSIAGRDVPLERPGVREGAGRTGADALLGVVDLDLLEDHLDLLRDVAFLGGGLRHLGHEHLVHRDREEGLAPFALAGRLAHFQDHLRKRLAGADVGQDGVRRAVEHVLPVHLAGAGLADRGTAALGPAGFRFDFPVPGLQLDPGLRLVVRGLLRLAFGLADLHERVQRCCHRTAPSRCSVLWVP